MTDNTKTEDKSLHKPIEIKKIVILGAGSFGTAIAVLFARNGHNVIILDRQGKDDRCKIINETHKNPSYLTHITLPSTITATTDPSILHGADLIFHAIPIQASRDYLLNLKSYIDHNTIIISMSKGIHCETLQFMVDIIAEVFPPSQPNVYLSGPSFASEIAEGYPTGFTIASNNEQWSTQVARLIHSDPRMLCITSSDVIGVEIGGALKNIYAIAAGICDGLGMKYNTKALLINRGCAEMRRLAVSMGAHALTLSGLSGYGDLMLTCTGPSRNRQVGERIGKGEKLHDIIASMSEVAEGVPTVKAAYTLAEQKGILRKLPILQQVYNILYNNSNIEQSIDILMTMNITDEDF